MKISIALPSNISIEAKEIIVSKANKKNLGIFLSDLPPNYDLFQLLSLWQNKYSNLNTLGTAIISPLAYEFHQLKKQIITVFEINSEKIEIGLGVGDRKFISKDITKPFSIFKLKVSSIVNDTTISNNKHMISVAGSGKKLMEFANNKQIGLIFNGIPDQSIIDNLNNEITLKNISCFIMTDFASFNKLSSSFIEIVSRILTSLSKGELVRLKIKSSEIDEIKEKIDKNDLKSYIEWFDPLLIKKVAFFGSYDEFLLFQSEMERLNIKQIIISIPNEKGRNYFFENYK